MMVITESDRILESRCRQPAAECRVGPGVGRRTDHRPRRQNVRSDKSISITIQFADNFINPRYLPVVRARFSSVVPAANSRRRNLPGRP
jgi:hypothetical protein